MRKNKRAITLIEVSVFIICSMILFISISNTISSQDVAVKKMIENNNLLFILDSVSAKIKHDLKSGKNIDTLDYDEYSQMLCGSSYQLAFRDEGDKIEILLGVYKNTKFGHSSIRSIEKVYKKEVMKNE